LRTVAGVSAGLIPLFLLSLAGASTLLISRTWLFDLARLAGMLYLVYLGVTILVSGFKDQGRVTPGRRPEKRFFLKGVLICVTNPKGILFAGAFFPQFLDKASPLIPQGLILCSGCLAVATAIGAGYAVFAGTADSLFQSEKFRKYSSRLSGLVLIFFGIGLLFTGSLELI
jgi:threonine/homoserine/homoserine lactone efflux protein